MDLNEIKDKIDKLGDEKSKLKEKGYSNKAFAQEETAPKSIVIWLKTSRHVAVCNMLLGINSNLAKVHLTSNKLFKVSLFNST